MAERVDWAAVIGQCKATKLSLRGIAYLTGLSTASIHNLSAGTVEPLHEHGERVIAFWSQCTGKTRDGLPTSSRPRTVRQEPTSVGEEDVMGLRGLLSRDAHFRWEGHQAAADGADRASNPYVGRGEEEALWFRGFDACDPCLRHEGIRRRKAAQSVAKAG